MKVLRGWKDKMRNEDILQKYFKIKEEKEYLKIKRHYKEKKFNIVEISISEVKDETHLFSLFSKVLKFPSYFGQNWNAFYDCLTDLEWLKLKKTIVFIKDIKAMKEKAFFEPLIGVLIDTHNWWSKLNITFDLIIIVKNREEKEILQTLKHLETILNKIDKEREGVNMGPNISSLKGA